jgi:hypothetical protein
MTTIVHVNERFMAEKRALWLVVALLYSQVGAWVYQAFRALDEPLDQRIASCLDELYGWQAHDIDAQRALLPGR